MAARNYGRGSSVCRIIVENTPPSEAVADDGKRPGPAEAGP
jgi:hypothetical protein